MGTDIGGFVEVRPGWGEPRTSAWEYVADLDHLYTSRDYDLFGCLFGVRNFAGFRPVASGRGVPTDLSRRGTEEWRTWAGSSHDPSWVTWAELAAIDLDEPAERADQRVHTYRLTPEGRVYESKAGFSRRVADAIAASGMTPAAEGEPWPVGTEWADGEYVHRVELLRRRDVLPGSMGALWQILGALGELHGAANVRLVVWFDS